jgi:hypothetical protein
MLEVRCSHGGISSVRYISLWTSVTAQQGMVSRLGPGGCPGGEPRPPSEGATEDDWETQLRYTVSSGARLDNALSLSLSQIHGGPRVISWAFPTEHMLQKGEGGEARTSVLRRPGATR